MNASPLPTAPPVAPQDGARHPGSWRYPVVVLVAFCTLIGASGFRSAPGVLIEPLHAEFGWSTATISSAVSLNLLLYGLFSPFAAALMERFGVRRVVVAALCAVACGSGLTVFMTAPWQLWLLWGVVIGAGTGSMAMPFVAVVTARWFVARRGLVTGILTAAQATGQLVFLPIIAHLAMHFGWRLPALVIAGMALYVVPLVVFLLREYPADVGLPALGATAQDPGVTRSTPRGNPARTALAALAGAVRHRTFWLLALSFAICGATTNGLVGTHFVPAAHDHGMPATTAAGLLALVGIFDVLGTVASGWLTDRIDPRLLLLAYYGLRGVSLVALPLVIGPHVQPPLWAFIVFYGLDWVATVPPTVALCVRAFGRTGPIVFGWVFASHQVGAAVAALGAGVLRDATGSYDGAWFAAAGLCGIGALASLLIPRRTAPRTALG